MPGTLKLLPYVDTVSDVHVLFCPTIYIFMSGKSGLIETAPDMFAMASEQRDEKAYPRKSLPNAKTVARFNELVLPHLDAAHNLARFLCRDADVAEDIVQEAYLRAFRSFAEFRGGSGRAFILTIIRNCYLNWRKSRRASKLVQIETDHIETPLFETDVQPSDNNELLHEGDDPEMALLRQMEGKAVRATLEELPEVFREVLILRDLEDCSYKEISDVLGVPAGTVMSRLARARKLFEAAWRCQLIQEDKTK